MLSIQTDYSTLTAVLGRRAHSHREALSSAAFVADQVLRSCSSYGEDSLDALQYMHGEWWSPTPCIIIVLVDATGGLHARRGWVVTPSACPP